MKQQAKCLREIFDQALEIADSERHAFLNVACAGDAGLRERALALLKAHAAAGSFLDQPALADVAIAPGSDTEVLESTPRETNDPPSEPARPEPPSEEVLRLLSPSSRNGSLGRLGHYEVVQVLGKGGFGTVFKAFDEKLHRMVAIKVLAPELAAAGTARERFLREARAAAAVRHEHIVNIYAVEGDGQVPYLVMEYVAGQTLQQKLEKSGPLELRQILRIAQQIALGLAAAHKVGKIHRDIKPGNILLENGIENVRITDFGLARAMDDATLTQTGLVAGTPAFMSPEQAEGNRLDQRSDLFSLGTVMYMMCTGRLPFRADGSMAVLKRICEDTPRPLREVNSDLPSWLADIIARLHAKDPAERYQSAQEVADELTARLAQVQMQSGFVSPAPSSSASEAPSAGAALPRPHRRRRNLVVLGCCALLLGSLILSESLGLTHLARSVVAWSRQIVHPEQLAGNADKEGKPPADPVRAGVEWALSLGGEVTARVGERKVPIRSKTDIPGEAMQVIGVDLEDTDVTDADLANLSSLPDLQELSLADTSISDDGLAHLKGLEKLARLDLSDTEVDGAGFAHLKASKKLSELLASNTNVNDAGMKSVGQLTELKKLDLASTDITDNGLAELAKLKKLRSLDLRNTSIGDAGLKHFEGLKNLTVLNLRKTDVTRPAAVKLSRTLPNCRIEIDSGTIGPAKK